MFLPEHHYYGESKPTKDIDVEDMVHLKMKQELRDLGCVINNLHPRSSHIGACSVSNPSYDMLDNYEDAR